VKDDSANGLQYTSSKNKKDKETTNHLNIS